MSYSELITGIHYELNLVDHYRRLLYVSYFYNISSLENIYVTLRVHARAVFSFHRTQLVNKALQARLSCLVPTAK